MLAQYAGNEMWDLYFDDRIKVRLSTHNIEELVEQSEDILYNYNETKDKVEGNNNEKTLYE